MEPKDHPLSLPRPAKASQLVSKAGDTITIPEDSPPPGATGFLQLAARVRRIDRRLSVLRTTETLIKWTTLPGLGTLAILFLRRTIELGAFFSVTTVGNAALVALGYGILRSHRRRLLNEIEDLESERSLISTGKQVRESVDGTRRRPNVTRSPHDSEELT